MLCFRLSWQNNVSPRSKAELRGCSLLERWGTGLYSWPEGSIPVWWGEGRRRPQLARSCPRTYSWTVECKEHALPVGPYNVVFLPSTVTDLQLATRVCLCRSWVAIGQILCLGKGVSKSTALIAITSTTWFQSTHQ